MLRDSRFAGAAAIGAGLMYYLDPLAGRRRRALVRDRVTHWNRVMRELLEKSSRDFNHRMRGLVSETRSRVVIEHVPDEVLVERVRSKIGHIVSHPHALRVEASQGQVSLSGPIFGDHIHELVDCVSRVRGVTTVRNNLSVYSVGAPLASSHNGAMPMATGAKSRRGARSLTRMLGLGIGSLLFSGAAYFLIRSKPVKAGLCALGFSVYASGLGEPRAMDAITSAASADPRQAQSGDAGM